MKYLVAATYGSAGAAAWAWWVSAVAWHSPTQAALADVALISISAMNISFIAQKRYGEFVAYTVAAAAGTWLAVFLSA
jgi:hypothetical protein